MIDYEQQIKRTYPHLDEEDIRVMFEIAKQILLNTLYPFNDEEEIEIPKRYDTWLYRCVIEQIERKGMTSAIAYQENGIRVSFDRSQISQGLLDEITPVCGCY